MTSLIVPFLNLLILVTVLVVYLRKPLRDFVSSRHTGIAASLREAQENLRTAQKDHQEFSAKLKAISAELQSIRDQAKEDARLSRDRIAAEARQLSERVVVDAKATAQGMIHELQAQLYAQTADQVFAKVEGLLKERLTGEDQARIRKQFSEQMRTAL